MTNDTHGGQAVRDRPPVLSYGREPPLRGPHPPNALLLRFVGLGMFAVSLFVPAIDPNMGAWEKPGETYTGLACLVFGMWWYPSNLLLLASPLAAWLARRPGKAALLQTMRGLYVLSTLWVIGIVFWPETDRFLLGFYLWAASHVLVTASFWGSPAMPRRHRPLNW